MQAFGYETGLQLLSKNKMENKFTGHISCASKNEVLSTQLSGFRNIVAFMGFEI